MVWILMLASCGLFSCRESCEALRILCWVLWACGLLNFGGSSFLGPVLAFVEWINNMRIMRYSGFSSTNCSGAHMTICSCCYNEIHHILFPGVPRSESMLAVVKLMTSERAQQRSSRDCEGPFGRRTCSRRLKRRIKLFRYARSCRFSVRFISVNLSVLWSRGLAIQFPLHTIFESLEVLLRHLSRRHRRSNMGRMQSTRGEEASKASAVTGWDSLPHDVQEKILQSGDLEDLSRFKCSWKALKELVDSPAFIQARPIGRDGTFTALHHYIENNEWRCRGFDLQSKRWRSLPPFSPALPPPEADLFKEFSFHSHGGLICAEVAKFPEKGVFVVINSLTRKRFQLPPLLHPRAPVLVHIWVDPNSNSYKVIVAGSSSASDEHLSRKMEVFDSETLMWEEAPDLPGPAFGLNEHQAGVIINGTLYMIAFLEGGCSRGVVAFDVEERRWLGNKTYAIPFSFSSNSLQLFESDGELVLFSEQEQGRRVEHCIHVLVEGPGLCYWRNVVRVKKSGGRGLQVYPEHVCVPFGEGKVCVFNALERDGVVYDLKEGRKVDVLEAPPLELKGEKFYTMNPNSFILQPRLNIDPAPTLVLIQQSERLIGKGQHCSKDQRHYRGKDQGHYSINDQRQHSGRDQGQCSHIVQGQHIGEEAQHIGEEGRYTSKVVQDTGVGQYICGERHHIGKR